MKYTHIFLLSLFCFSVLSACKSDTTNTTQTPAKLEKAPQKVVITDTPKVEGKETISKPKTEEPTKATPPPPPPKDKKRISEEDRLANISPFLSSGCCKDKTQRQKDCCCNAVLEQYKKMTTANNPKLVEYSMTDPILGACKRKKSDAFDAIDNPPVEKAEDDFSDLF